MSKAKDKGRRYEHKTVAFHTALGVVAKRVPLSGMLGGEWSDDVTVPYGRLEVKARANGAGWQVIKKWMKGCHGLFLWADRTAPLVVLTADAYADLVQRAYGDLTMQRSASHTSDAEAA